MAKAKYYDPTELLTKKDLDGEEPSIYMVTSNRSAGKTTAFLKLQLEDFKNSGKKAMLLYRQKYETRACSQIYSDVLRLYPELGVEMKAESRAEGLYYEMFLDGESFGYACALNNPDQLKKYSPIFADVYNIVMDEFQTESGKYLPKEVQKLQSLLLTIARGGGAQSRKVRLFLLGNMVSIMNPYFIYFNIHKRLKADTRFIRGKGWVAQFEFNESASAAIKSSGIYKAFANDDYMNYSTENVYLIDSEIFIQSPKGKSKYIYTIVHDDVKYGVREYFEDGLLYVSRKVDNSCKLVVTFKASNHTQNTIMLNHYSYLWKNVRDAYQGGFLRFDDIQSKNAIYDILAVDMYK